MKVIYTILGILFTAIGSIGIILPILPTTPFLLVAAVCFAKGSARFEKLFKSTKIYKNHLESFVEEGSMRIDSKLKICAFATFFMMIAFFMMSNIYGRVTILLVLAIKYYYFAFKIKTI